MQKRVTKQSEKVTSRKQITQREERVKKTTVSLDKICIMKQEQGAIQRNIQRIAKATIMSWEIKSLQQKQKHQ